MSRFLLSCSLTLCSLYCIIIYGGKLSQLQAPVEILRKAFTAVSFTIHLINYVAVWNFFWKTFTVAIYLICKTAKFSIANNLHFMFLSFAQPWHAFHTNTNMLIMGINYWVTVLWAKLVEENISASITARLSIPSVHFQIPSVTKDYFLIRNSSYLNLSCERLLTLNYNGIIHCMKCINFLLIQ